MQQEPVALQSEEKEIWTSPEKWGGRWTYSCRKRTKRQLRRKERISARYEILIEGNGVSRGKGGHSSGLNHNDREKPSLERTL